MKVGVEIAFGFGDSLFAMQAIKSIANNHNCKVDVATQGQCSDAFTNAPFIGQIIDIPTVWHGVHHFHANQYNFAYQMTPYAKFAEYKAADGNFSLIDCSKKMAAEQGIEISDQRPLIYLTDDERKSAEEFINRLPNTKPIVGIESYAKSGQSWADREAIDKIITYWRDKAHILWFSNTKAHDGALDLVNFRRREIIAMLGKIDHFYSVGSGFFCASLVASNQPKRTTVLWIDHYYKYIHRIAELGWGDTIEWAQNIVELEAFLHSYDGHY